MDASNDRCTTELSIFGGSITKEIKESCERMSFLNTKIRKLSLIVDNNLFLNLIKEIQYFYVRGLLNEIELDTLKVELHKYLDDIETTIK